MWAIMLTPIKSPYRAHDALPYQNLFRPEAETRPEDRYTLRSKAGFWDRSELSTGRRRAPGPDIARPSLISGVSGDAHVYGIVVAFFDVTLLYGLSVS